MTTNLGSRGVHHVSFCVADLAAARDFYENLLGLAPIARPELGIPGVWYRAGAVELHLLQVAPGDERGRPPSRLSPLADHLAFAIPDFAAALAWIEAQGRPVVATRPEQGQLWIQDPDGHVIELTVQGPTR